MKIKYNTIKGRNFEKLPYDDFIASFDSLLSLGWVKEDLGVCSDGINHVFGLSLGDVSKPTIFIDGGIHGYNEWRSCYWVRDFAEEIVQPTDAIHSSLMSQLRAKFHFYIIPSLNPYGYINFTRWNANTVDINRNFDAFWEDYEPEGGGWGGKGAFPFSEPETQMVRDKVLELRPVFYANTHSWGAGAGGTNALCAPDYQDMYEAGFDAVMAMRYNIETEEIIYYGQPVNPRPISSMWVSSIPSQFGREPLAVICESGFRQPIIDESYIGMNQLLAYCIKMLDFCENGNMLFN